MLGPMWWGALQRVPALLGFSGIGFSLPTSAQAALHSASLLGALCSLPSVMSVVVRATRAYPKGASPKQATASSTLMPADSIVSALSAAQNQS